MLIQLAADQNDVQSKLFAGEELTRYERGLISSGESSPEVVGSERSPALVVSLGALGMTESEKNYRLSKLDKIRKRHNG